LAWQLTRRYRELREKYQKLIKLSVRAMGGEKEDQSKIRTHRNLVLSPYIEQMMKDLPDSRRRKST